MRKYRPKKKNLQHSCRYYIEVLHQEHAGAADINIGFFKEDSTFTEDQTDDAVNEVQYIIAKYDVYDEEQVRDLSDLLTCTNLFVKMELFLASDLIFHCLN